jgi:hypothetical protein
MDMSANALLKALDHAGAMPAFGKGIFVYPGRWAPSDARLGCRDWSLAGMFLPASAPPHPAVSNAVLIAVLSLSLAGCSVLQPGTTAGTTPPPQAGTKGAHELASAAKQPEAPSKPAQPVPQHSQRISEPRPLPATASKGAEKLMTPSAPAPVLASERTTLPAEPSSPKPPATEDSGTVTGTPVQALVFKGPPPQLRPRRAGMKALLWLGVGLGGAALAVLARFYVIRRAKPEVLANAGKDELKMPPELLFKEPMNLPQEVPVAEET